MEGRKQFTFYRSYYDALKVLPEALWKQILVAVIEYGLFGKEPEGLEPVQQACFILIKPTLETGIKRAAATKKLNFDEKINFNKGETEKEKEIEIEKEIETETESESEGAAGACFERFWNLYPVKIGKSTARKAWDTLCPDDREVQAGLQRWLDSCQWKKEDGRFIPRAAKFLSEKHYLESPRQAVPMGATGVLGEAEIDAIRQVMEGEV